MAKDSSEKIEKITPSPSELVMSTWQEKLPVECPEPGCSHVASNLSVLNLHKAKIHKITTSLDKSVIKQFHCPISSCYFNSTSERYFKSLDILRVHYMKVHYEKNFKCAKCDKRFGLARDCQHHEEECGQLFTCPDCGKVYTKKDSLLKHCDVQKHTKPNFPSRSKPVKKSRAEKTKRTEAKAEVRRKTPKQSCQVILPKESQSVNPQRNFSQVQLIAFKPSQSVCQAAQALAQPLSSNVMSVGIQTASHSQEPVHASFQCVNEKISMGIQTIVLVPSLQQSDAQIQTKGNADKSIFNQTAISNTKINKSTQKSPFKNTLKQNVIKSSSSSQTNLPTLSKRPDGRLRPTASLNLPGAKKSMSFSSPSLWNTDFLASPHVEKQKKQSEDNHSGLASSIEEILTNISTQTDFSCLLNQVLPDSQNNNLCQLPTRYNSHTQTSDNELCQFSIDGLQDSLHLFEDKNIQTCQLNYQEKITQTKAENYKSIYSQTSVDLSNTLTSRKRNFPKLKSTYDSCQNDACSKEAQDKSMDQLNFMNKYSTLQNCNEAQTYDHKNSQSVSLQSMLTDICVPDDYFPESSLKSNALQDSTKMASTEVRDASTLNDFAWGIGTQTFNNPMWEIGTQTFEDFAAEIGTQTKVDFTLSQATDSANLEMGTQTRADLSSLQIEPQDVINVSALQRLSPQGSGNKTQTKRDNLIYHETGGMSWESTSKTIGIYKLESQVPRMNNIVPHRGIENPAAHDLNFQTDFQTLQNLDIETQTMIGIPLSESTFNVDMDTGAQTEAELTTSQTAHDLRLEIGTQTIVDINSFNSSFDLETQTTNDLTYLSTLDHLSLDMGTQTVTDISSLSLEDNSGFNMATQTMTDFPYLGLNTETQTMTGIYSDLAKWDNMNLETGTQTVADITPLSWDTGCLEMETQTVTDIPCLSSASDHCLEMGTQTSVDMTFLPSMYTSGLKTNTMADIASLQATEDLGSDMETQLVTDTTAYGAFDIFDKMIAREAMVNTAQQCVNTLDSEIGIHSMSNLAGWQAQDCQSFETGTQTMTNMRALPTVDDLSFAIGTQTLEQFITNSCTQTENTGFCCDDVVTQTEEDLLEFLTRETQTQTGDDLLEFLTRESQTQTYNETWGDERAAQTDRDLLDFFTTATQTQVMEALSTQTLVNNAEVGTGDDLLEFFTKENETQTQACFELG